MKVGLSKKSICYIEAANQNLYQKIFRESLRSHRNANIISPNQNLYQKIFREL